MIIWTFKKRSCTVLCNILLIAVISFWLSACDNTTPAHLRPTPVENHQRMIIMDEITNLRDLGGYKTRDGKQLAWGKIYRSANLHKASAQDLIFIENKLGIKQVIDFRDTNELGNEPDPLSITQNSSINYTSINILLKGTSREDIVKIIKNGTSEAYNFAELLKTANRKLALNHQQHIKQWFDILLENDGPFLFHCSEGKDRTGFATALLLSALNVNKETIYNDYLMTNKAIAEHLESRINIAYLLSRFKISRAQLRQLMTVDKSYLEAGFSAIEKHYGSVDNYLEKAIGIDSAKKERLRKKFLL